MSPKTKSMAVVRTEQSFTPDQIDMIKNMFAKGTTDSELQLFLYTCKRTGLDPLTKQIYCVKRAGQMAIQTGIDGYRAIAERTGTLAGIDDAVFDTETDKHPNKATVTVYRLINGQRVPFTASARWSEYNQPSGFAWTKMPYLMLGKCAESLALRKAFPNDLSGLYTTEEMSQAETHQNTEIEAEVIEQQEPKELLSRDQLDRLNDLIKELEADPAEVNRFIVSKKKVGMQELTEKQADEVIILLEERIKFKENVKVVEEAAKEFGGELVEEPKDKKKYENPDLQKAYEKFKEPK